MTQLMPKPTNTPDQPTWPDFDQLEPVVESQVLRDLRQKAKAAFQAVGFPTAKTEEWRFTKLAPITQTPYVSSASITTDHHITEQDIAPLLLDGDVDRVVFINGRYAPELSQLPDQEGVSFWPIMELARENPERLAELLAAPTLHEDPFSDMNMALFDDGIVLIVEPNTNLARPIHLLNLAVPQSGSQSGQQSDEGQPWMAHERSIITIGTHSHAQIIEHYATLTPPGSAPSANNDPGVYWRNALTQITLADHAKAEHYFIDEEGDQGRNITSLLGQLGSHSHLASHTALFGGQLVRNNIHVELRGPYAETMINGLYIGHDEQTLDNHMRVVHGSTNCDSHQYYNGILADRSKGVFTGRIVVEEDAQKTDAKQTNRNLVLSDTARIHTNPQLEIFADDVKCTHGATTGRLDPEALFYFQSRGVPAEQARIMLIHAFAHENLDRITLPCVLQRLEQLLTASLVVIDPAKEATV